ncbi:hypothetical protein CSOJ01_10489 [Colletotrichum sojae]|uniref:Heterokaryon incompatibility domain-containing protein n=1 Tax=Colletotrichum sojae TaxID=2175907 RepID=A0A8H6J0A3_9PEZI|nr:hypothetical protein CSOJ01_10489 [Colletotrichum sojae]
MNVVSPFEMEAREGIECKWINSGPLIPHFEKSASRAVTLLPLGTTAMLESLQSLYSDTHTLFNVPYHPILDACHPKHQNGFADFIEFPTRHGWKLNDDYTLVEEPDEARSCKRLEKEPLFQAWIFFQLHRSFFSINRHFVPHPGELIRGGDHKRLHTGALTETARRWHTAMLELLEDDPGEAILQLSRANQLLEMARQVVIMNLAEGSSARVSQGRQSEVNSEDKLSLGLMIFGETLTGLLSQTVKACGVSLPGWQADDDGGWGPPTLVTKEMEGWCPRSRKVLKGQLGRNATLLFAAVRANVGNETNIHRQHSANCTEEKCTYIQAAKSTDVNSYKTEHHPTCPAVKQPPKETTCYKIGPDLADIREILEHGDSNDRFGSFPLLKIFGPEDNPKIEVRPWTKNVRFATISHVWAQGLGNKNGNEIWSCQLEEIRMYVRNVFKSKEDEFFWLDTLAIPQNSPNPVEDRLKTTAISRIYHVFQQAACCIIIDRHLISTGTVSRDCRTTASGLLASAWMMRLWTLQEAFLSKELHLAVGTDVFSSREVQKVLSIDTMWDDAASDEVLTNATNEMTQRKLFYGMMGSGRLSRKPPRDRSRALLVAEAWRGTRYRTIDILEHETRVLASLFNIPIPRSHIPAQPESRRQEPSHRAIFFSRLPFRQRISDQQIHDDSERREDLMVEFWKHFSKCGDQTPEDRSIPSGIIFLPGSRLSARGFGWAPVTWMSHQEESYPYPLSTPKYPTLLHNHGLVVHYPGFILYASAKGLGQIVNRIGGGMVPFDLVVNRGLHEWYRVSDADVRGHGTEVMDAKEKSAQDHIDDDLAQRMKNDPRSLRFGIILSRQRPVEFPGEIGLLVELQKSEHQDKDDEQRDETNEATLYCHIIRRVLVSHLPPGAVGMPGSASGQQHVHTGGLVLKKYTDFGSANLIGVAVADNRAWCVDGYEMARLLKVPEAPGTPPLPGRHSQPRRDSEIGKSLKRAFSIWGGRV